MDDNARFHGSVPGFYDRHLGPFLFGFYSEELARRLAVRAGGRVLEIACGTGRVTRLLVPRLPEGASLVATDLNQAMIDFATSVVTSGPVTWQTADAGALPFGDGAFDAVVCGFGLMFVPDKAAALREAHRVLAPGGKLLASVWCSLRDNPAIEAIHTKVLEMFPDDPPRFLATTPYGFGDPEFWKRGLREAGFANVSVERVAHVSEAPAAEDLATGFVKGSPLFAALADRGADHDAVIRAVTPILAAHGGSRPFRSGLAALILEAS